VARRIRRRLAVALTLALTLGLVPAAPATVLAVTGSGYNLAIDSIVYDNPLDRHGTDADSTIAMTSSTSTALTLSITDTQHQTFAFQLSSGTDPTKVGTYSTGDGFGSTLQISQTGGYGCVLTGSFTVLAITHDGSGHVTSLAAHVDGSCAPSITSAVADLRFQNAVPYSALAFTDVHAFPDVPATGTGTNDLTIVSEGTGPLTIGSLALEGADAADFAIDDESCTAGPIAVASTCTVTLAWTAEKSNEAVTLVVNSDSARAASRMTFGGAWASPFTAPTLDFGTVLLNHIADPEPLVVTNVGSQSFPVNQVHLGGSNVSDFAITDDACTGMTLAPSGTCAIEVIARPSFAGQETATIQLDPPAPYPSLQVAVHITGEYPAANTASSALHNASADFTYNGGNALGRTVTSGGTAYLHAVASATRVGTTAVKDAGPYAPILYTRGNPAGSTWSSAVRLNPTAQHGIWPGLAASGSNVYASWVKVSKVVSFSTSAPRWIVFRANTNHGSSGSWGALKALTSTSGRVDYPSIAATGTSVYVAYTDANSGAVRLLVSHDRGATFKAVTLATTTATSSAGGRSALPSVAASGDLVIVGWIGDNNGAVRGRISRDGGATWGSTANLATASLSYPSAAATTNRAGIAWIGAEPTVALWTVRGKWHAPIEVPNVNHIWLEVIYGPALVLSGAGTLGVGYSGCVQDCVDVGTFTHFESYYAESPNNGIDWYNGSSVAVGSGQDGRRGADGLSAIASSSTKRDFLFTFWQPGTSTTRLVHRSITITPTVAPSHVITPRRAGGPALHPPDAVPPPSALRSRLPFRS
jgi:hypothetical protein